MRNKLISVTTVTKDRIKLYKEFINKIMNHPDKDFIEWIVVDNSNDRIHEIKRKLTPKFVRYLKAPDYCSSRNVVLKSLRTKYFFIVDDDDFIVEDFYARFLDVIHKYKDADFISFGRKSSFDHQFDGRISRIEDKVGSLYDFGNYKNDRDRRVYPCNSGNIYLTDLFRENKIQYFYNYADDTYPILKAYILSKCPIRSNNPIFIYSGSGTWIKRKTGQFKIDYFNAFQGTYRRLLCDFAMDPLKKVIVMKQLYNSLQQCLLSDGELHQGLLRMI